MMKNLFIIAAIAICFGLTANIFAQNARPTPVPGTYVTAEFLTYGADNTTLNKVRMDQPGIPYSNGIDGVSANFFLGTNASRDLVIRLDGSTRTVFFDFSEVSSYTNAPSWLLSSPIQSFKPQMNILGAHYAKENCLPVGGVYDCNFQTRMNAGYLKISGINKTTYALLWNPETMNPRPVKSPESTSFVNVNYYKGLDNQEVFTIAPLPNCATRANNFTCAATDVKRVIAGLEATTGKNVSSAGQYVMPFTLVVRPK